MAGKKFWQKLLVDCADTLQLKNLFKITLTRSLSEISAFYAEIQDGWEKWQEKDFCKNSADILWFKNFFEISLASYVSGINPFFAFYAEIQDG